VETFPASIIVQAGDVLGWWHGNSSMLLNCVSNGGGPIRFGPDAGGPVTGDPLTITGTYFTISLNLAANFVPACTRTINGYFPGSVTVASGEIVCIVNATVGGAVTVRPGGSLRVESSTINGAITSTGASQLRLCGSTLVGAVKAQSSTGPVQIGDDDDGCAANTLRSGLTVTGNTGGYEVTGNTITGTTTISSNTSADPGEESEIKNNQVGSWLNCTGNAPPPTGGGNTAGSGKTGQCALL
jgi:hexosaminidase